MYTPLYIKTDYSLLSSLIKIDDLIAYAINNNISSLAITDDNLCGVIEFYNKCLKNNIKPIIGLNLTINDYNIILYAKNYNGYLNLLNINTHIEEKTIDINILNKYNENLICIIPYESKKIKEKLNFKNIFYSESNETTDIVLSNNF